MSDESSMDTSMFSLFQMEVALQISLIQAVMPLFGPPEEEAIARDQLIRSFRSLRSAAKMVGIDLVYQLAAKIEAGVAQSLGQPSDWNQFQIPQLEEALSPFREIQEIQETDLQNWIKDQQPVVDGLILKMADWFPGDATETSSPVQAASIVSTSETASKPIATATPIDNTPFSTQYADDDMMNLFRVEVENHGLLLGQKLLELEQDPKDMLALESLMRSAHSIKGAARMVNVESVVQIAHAMENLFVAAQEGKLHLSRDHMDLFFESTDLIKEISKTSHQELASWHNQKTAEIRGLIASFGTVSSPGQPRKAEPAIVKSQECQVNEFLQATAPDTSAKVPTSFELDDDEVMLDLFRAEVETKTGLLREKLIEIEQDPLSESVLEDLMRAAQSLKGAAQMIKSSPVVSIAHLMEECFSTAQSGQTVINTDARSCLFTAVEMIVKISLVTPKQAPNWLAGHKTELSNLLSNIQTILAPATAAAKTPVAAMTYATQAPQVSAEEQSKRLKADTSIRVSTQSLNRLLGLAGESLVESRWVRPYTETLQTLKRRHVDLISTIDHLRELLMTDRVGEKIMALARQIELKASHCREEITDRISDMEDYERRSTNLAGRLNQEVIASRMRPFSDGVHGFRRMVRDLAKSLEKEVLLDIRGLNTKVDRDILEKIEAPLNHILRNAIDHGIELPDEREKAGKSRQATIRLEAAHVSGMLSVVVEDNGRGIDIDQIKRKIVERKLATAEMVASMTKPEILEFLFLPSFSTKESVTEISGRGVGLDVVLSVMQEMRGSVRAISNFGGGTKFHLQLPLTLSVVRALMVQIGGEPYAFPLARVERTMKLHDANIEVLEGREYFTFGNQHIGILDANQILGLSQSPPDSDVLSIVVIGERANRYGLVVDRFLGEKDLVVHPLDERLGKIKDVSASSIMDDGSPTLILDVEDILRSIDLLISGGRLNKHQHVEEFDRKRKRILVVDDSITVREVEKTMLESRGYEVAVAVDGVDGWNAVRADHYDLVISDIDMPRMNGIEFVSLIKRDHRLKSIPVMIVSYKDREEDRIRGMDAGADYYLTKGSFQDETLLEGVADLIGDA